MEVLLCSDTHYIEESECASKRPKLDIHSADTDTRTSSSYHSVVPVDTVKTSEEIEDGEDVIKCKICSSERFIDEQTFNVHWMDNHKKEAKRLFMEYACALCLDSFTNKNVLKAHMQERHRGPLVEQCVLFQCSSCGINLANPEDLLPHVLLMHTADLRLSNATKHHRFEGQLQKLLIEPNKTAPPKCNNMLENQSAVSSRGFNCTICGLEFDLLPELGRHHRAAHLGPQSSTELKSERSTRPLVRKKGSKSASCKDTNNMSMRSSTRCLRASDSVNLFEVVVKSSVPELSATKLGRSAESRCSAIAKQALYTEMKQTKARLSYSEILSIASSACCKTSFHASLQLKYGNLPARTHLKAVKLCSKHNISVEWQREAYICPKGCARTMAIDLPPLMPSSDHVLKARSTASSSQLTMDESHCVVDCRHISTDLFKKSVVLCDDVSLGRESIPIACVVDENLLNAVGPNGEMPEFSFPWESFVYVTKPLLGRSTFLESKSPQLQCACAEATCSPGTCDHVYLFDIDFEDVKDIYGESIRGRFPYDDRGRIILQEGYLVYECNQRCRCSKGCRNRVLQNGVQLKLEIFKTENKGWGVRSSEAVLRGTFVCEFIGEVIDEDEANERRIRRGEEAGCKYFYEVDADANDVSRLIEGQVTYVIDASEYGNVSRYINHSCSPNLESRQVLVESQLAHIGFYASRDIAPGEELTYDFRYKQLQLPGKACPCLCGSSNCRGRLH